MTSFGEDYPPIAQYMHGSAAREVDIITLVDDLQPALTSIHVDVQEPDDYDNYTEIVLAVGTASDALASVVRHGGQPMTANARDTALLVQRGSNGSCGLPGGDGTQGWTEECGERRVTVMECAEATG
ncbi:hypothetical protein CYMTET_45951 [Cymbomonas tetramitiformis]|uniref:Uncharacterized protein n=1 Tax=Cymbomonas tetramitiformis TaxID=36881 RepID=A0AAE0BX67_9CHLO|nr:hypothetical protein CYMTET_45951 [Cymbomonas tetramitiformis]